MHSLVITPAPTRIPPPIYVSYSENRRMSSYLGIDIGTSGTKTIVATVDGTILATASAEHPSSHPKPGWSEQNPADWWKSTVESTQKALAHANVKAGDVKGIGLSGQ